jgi:hypothetical protein
MIKWKKDVESYYVPSGRSSKGLYHLPGVGAFTHPQLYCKLSVSNVSLWLFLLSVFNHRGAENTHKEEVQPGTFRAKPAKPSRAVTRVHLLRLACGSVLINYCRNNQKESQQSCQIAVAADVACFAGKNENQPINGQQQKGEREEKEESIPDATPEI